MFIQEVLHLTRLYPNDYLRLLIIHFDILDLLFKVAITFQKFSSVIFYHVAI